MSVSHYFYTYTTLKEFPQELLDALKKFKEENIKFFYNDEILTKEDIGFALRAERPGSIFITTNPEHAYLNIKDIALFTFSKYYNGNVNLIFCQLALICKYYLKDKLSLQSNGFEQYIDENWVEAVKLINKKGFNIKIDNLDEEGYPIFLIDDKFVENTFDKEKKIFKTIFIPVNIETK